MPAELILWAQVSSTLRRAEPGGLHTTSYSINDILLALQKLVQLDRIKTYESYSIKPQTMICRTKLVM